jgi:protein lifeguard
MTDKRGDIELGEIHNE